MPADANRVQLLYRNQGTGFDVLGSGAPTEVRFTSESLKQTTDNASSDEIRDDRQRSDIIRTDIRAEGDINMELSYGDFDPFFSAALQDAVGAAPAVAWNTGTTIISSAACSFAGSVITLDSPTWTNNPEPGDVVQVSLTSKNDGAFTVVSATTGTITVNETLETESSVTSTITNGDYVVNGTVVSYFELQKEFLDIASFAYYKNMVVDSFNLTIEPGSIITGGFSFMGTSASSVDTLTVTPTGAGTNPVLNAIDNVGTIAAGSTLGALSGVTQIALTVSNNMRSRSEIGRLGSAQPGSGTIDVTGTLQMYMAGDTEIDNYLDWDTTALRFAVHNGATNAGMGYSFWLPKVKFTDGQRVAGGINTDVIAELSFTAYADADDGTIQIHRATD